MCKSNLETERYLRVNLMVYPISPVSSVSFVKGPVKQKIKIFSGPERN